ncbi:hypothetical protein Q5H93_07660 [Hymenobacter sp. ASUV-10]|uniref:Uncharacterized protein n=1 Tax=Hymenobacter aranciens TaxID=3063996 RepID=A0ABT9B8K7_9BACT|nr:hypothetical protein [Hymenobacter sp. ASUV-10]MDO7874604.1 hypothetical protein [Hymenobacter sp. ASUV-10]
MRQELSKYFFVLKGDKKNKSAFLRFTGRLFLCIFAKKCCFATSGRKNGQKKPRYKGAGRGSEKKRKERRFKNAYFRELIF